MPAKKNLLHIAPELKFRPTHISKQSGAKTPNTCTSSIQSTLYCSATYLGHTSIYGAMVENSHFAQLIASRNKIPHNLQRIVPNLLEASVQDSPVTRPKLAKKIKEGKEQINESEKHIPNNQSVSPSPAPSQPQNRNPPARPQNPQTHSSPQSHSPALLDQP